MVCSGCDVVSSVGLEDLKKHKIGALEAITDFFVNYKTADGKPKNELWENGKFLDQVRFVFVFALISRKVHLI